MLLALARRLPVGQPAAGADGSASGQGTARPGLDAGRAVGHRHLAVGQRTPDRPLAAGSGGRAVGRNELGDELRVEGGGARSSGSRSIDVIVSRLRRKAELAGVMLPIRTVYGSGYLFADQ